MKVVHVITGLEAGGAENMLFKLLSHGGDGDASVIALAGEGPMAAPIRALGVGVETLDLPAGARALRGLPRLAARLRAARPDVVLCWMYHANLLGGLAARLATRAPVIWGLRQTDLDPALSKASTLRVARLGARLSRWVPERILCVSESARRVHAALGYDEARMEVVPNGFDLDRFRPDADARARIRAELGIGADSVLIGLIARFDAQKDVGGFVAAARMLGERGADCRFLLCGQGMERGNPALDAMLEGCPIADRVHLLGRRDDMPAITAALDVAVSSSAFGEGFSNTLGEALCCAVPVVATDVGESRVIVGTSGRVVRQRDPAALADAMGEMVAWGVEERSRLGAEGRARMARDYSIAAIAARYDALCRAVIRRGGA